VRRLVLGAALAALLGSALPAAAGAADLHVHREVLPNGLVLQVVERPALPILTVQMGIRAGSRKDPPGAAGTADLVARLLTEGTITRSAGEIADQIEFVGGRLGAEAERDFARVTVTVLKRDEALGMDLLADIVRRPAFKADEVERVKKEVLGEIEANEDQPDVVAGKAFDRAVYGTHPYAHPEEGDPDTVTAATPASLMSFHRIHYLPNNAVISFVGDVTVEEARVVTLSAFGDWQRHDEEMLDLPLAAPPQGIDLVTIDRPVTQATVIMGHLGLERADPDFYPAVVMNYILGGGGFASRLVHEVRQRQGLAYAIGSGFHAMKDPGDFVVRFQTRNAAANQAIASVLGELRRIRTERVSEEELADAKANLVGGFPLRIDTNGETADLLTFIEMYGLGTTYFTDYIDKVEAVTRDDVLRVAKTYLHPEDMVWVVVGNLAEADVHVPPPPDETPPEASPAAPTPEGEAAAPEGGTAPEPGASMP
jgi:zinc protease